jgi:large subunit ribosomal protein L9
MEVILLERIEKLGQLGDVVNVKPGYARNFLLPKKKALRANKESRALFESQRSQLEAVNLQRKSEAEAAAAKMTDLKIIMVRQAGESGQLYGSVSGRDVADSIKAAGYSITRQMVNLDTPIKTLGVYEVHVSLHPEVSITATVVVARSLEDADRVQNVAAAAAAAEAAADAEDAAAEAAEAAAAAAAEAAVEAEVPAEG